MFESDGECNDLLCIINSAVTIECPHFVNIEAWTWKTAVTEYSYCTFSNEDESNYKS